MASTKKTEESKEQSMASKEESEEEESGSQEGGDDDEDEEGDDDDVRPIDLSENEIYRGVCTLLEDEDGNNILEYISLLHTELIGINKSLENLKGMRKDISRLADCAELFFKTKKSEVKDVTDSAKVSESRNESRRDVTDTSRKEKSRKA